MSYEASLRQHYASVSERLRPVPRAHVLRRLPMVAAPVVSKPAPATEWRALAATVAAQHEITVDALLGRSRARNIVDARQEFYFRMVVERRLSMPNAARLLGRDHTTILYGLRKYLRRFPEKQAEYEAYLRSKEDATIARNERVVAMYRDGASLLEIIAECHISSAHIQPVIVAAGLPLRAPMRVQA